MPNKKIYSCLGDAGSLSLLPLIPMATMLACLISVTVTKHPRQDSQLHMKKGLSWLTMSKASVHDGLLSCFFGDVVAQYMMARAHGRIALPWAQPQCLLPTWLYFLKPPLPLQTQEPGDQAFNVWLLGYSQGGLSCLVSQQVDPQPSGIWGPRCVTLMIDFNNTQGSKRLMRNTE